MSTESSEETQKDYGDSYGKPRVVTADILVIVAAPSDTCQVVGQIDFQLCYLHYSIVIIIRLS